MLLGEDFTITMTGARAVAQNAYAKSQNKYVANMMMCLLHAADLGSKCWSFALIHAVFINNRIPHTFINMAPYKAITGSRSDRSTLRKFGCWVYVRKPGDKKAKLDKHTSNGVFVGYTSTMKNVYYIENSTSVLKIRVRKLFNEAHFTSPRSKQPIAAQAL